MYNLLHYLFNLGVEMMLSVYVIISSLMQMVTSRGLFHCFPCKDLYANLSKANNVCKSSVGG